MILHVDKTQKINSEGHEESTVGSFLVRRLLEIGVEKIFGVPGDFLLGFLNKILQSKLQYIGCCSELNAAYAADSTSRLKGIGAVATTYAVGELSALNGVAGSYCESVPVVNITGCPPSSEFKKRALLHHTLGNYGKTRDIYSHITIANCLIDKAETAVAEIDRVLHACLASKKPVYIGICADIVQASCLAPTAKFAMPLPGVSDPNALEEAVLEVLKRVHEARNPLLIPGLEIRRFALEKEFLQLLERSGLPYATMMLGKTIISERHPQHIGLYCGSRSRDYVKQFVESSDCVMVFGEKLTDFNTGGFTHSLDNRSTIFVDRDSVTISFHTFHGVYINDFIHALNESIHKRNYNKKLTTASEACVHRAGNLYEPIDTNKITMNRFFDRMASFIPENSIVLAETGSSLFCAAEVLMPEGVHFMGQTYYGSIGYTIGATLGACLSSEGRPVILFIGDGSFQMTCQDLSTIVRHGCKPIIFLLNNDGYTIERVICDNTYNDIQMWQYSKIPEVFGADAYSAVCNTEGDLENVLAGIDHNRLNFIEIKLDRFDCSNNLKISGKALAKSNYLVDENESISPIKRKMMCSSDVFTS